MSKILFGTDPECFAAYQRNGTLYSLPPYYFRQFLGVPIEIDEDKPEHPIFVKGDGFFAHEDGAAFEFSIRPSFDPKELFDRIQEVAKQVSEKILSRFPNQCLPTLQFLPTIGFDVERWQAELGDIHREDFAYSTRFGCDPDSDVFDLSAKCKVMDASLHPERYGGGHIHASGSKKFQDDPDLAVKCMAMSAGVAAVAYSDVPELEKARTFLYGKPGKFRIQNYGAQNPFGLNYSLGIEYRTTSCRWANDWNIAQKVFEWMEIGINQLFEKSLGLELLPELQEPAIKAILEADQKLASEVLSRIESRL